MKYEFGVNFSDPLVVFILCAHAAEITLMTLVRKNTAMEVLAVLVNILIVLVTRQIHIQFSLRQPWMMQKGIISVAYFNNGLTFVTRFIKLPLMCYTTVFGISLIIDLITQILSINAALKRGKIRRKLND